MEEEDKTPSSRSPKRPQTSTSPSSSEKRRRLSSNDATMRDGTLRIVTEMLRSENRQLLQDREVLEKEKNSLNERLTQIQRSLRDLEDDVARIYRQKQKEMDAQRREFEQKLQDAQDPAGQEEAKEIMGMILPSERTTQEMDKLLQSCELWQERLDTWSRELSLQVEKVEAQEVQSVMRDLVTTVEMKTLKDKLKAKDVKLQWAIWFQTDAANCLKEMHRNTQETEVFEAMEKQLMDDRVVELETQLTQKRAAEREKEMELSSLRADQEELLRSSRVVPNEEFEVLVAEKKAMDAEVKQLEEKMKQQTEELERADEERASLKQQKQKLVEETRQLREKQETNEFEIVQQNMTQDEEIKKLQAQLQAAKTREAKMATALKAAEKQMEKSKQQKEELNIVYAKFSSTMDSVSEKTMRIEELEQELKDARNIHEKLEKQVAQLHQEKSDLSAVQHGEKDGMSEELVKLQKQYAELRELESQQKALASKMHSEATELKAQNEALRQQQAKQVHQSVGQSSNEGGKRSTDSDNTLTAQVAEKEALLMFLQRYYSAAEEKCSRLLEKVSELESQKTLIQEQTNE